MPLLGHPESDYAARHRSRGVKSWSGRFTLNDTASPVVLYGEGFQVVRDDVGELTIRLSSAVARFLSVRPDIVSNAGESVRIAALDEGDDDEPATIAIETYSALVVAAPDDVTAPAKADLDALDVTFHVQALME